MRLSKVLSGAAPVLAAIFATLLFAGAAHADRLSATMVYDDGGYVTESKVYVHDSNYRIEPGASYEPVLIARKDDNVMFRIDRETGFVSEDVFRESDLPPILYPAKTVNMVSQGESEYDGVACVKYKVTLLDIGGNEVNRYRWVDMYVGRLLKVQAEDESWTYYLKDIDVGSQDPALFEDPVGAVSEEGDGEEYVNYGDDEDEDYDTDTEYEDESSENDEDYSSDDDDSYDDDDDYDEDDDDSYDEDDDYGYESEDDDYEDEY